MKEERKTVVIALVGKGGVGKTSLSALIVRLLAQRYPDKKILAIDADPAVGLANPEGFMTRVSLINSRESARVSRNALRKGLNFSTVGSMMLREYHKNASIRSVKLIFITDPEFPFRSLQTLTKESEKITKAIDHILRTEMTDCGACSLQKICSEVDGMKELHFGLTQ